MQIADKKNRIEKCRVAAADDKFLLDDVRSESKFKPKKIVRIALTLRYPFTWCSALVAETLRESKFEREERNFYSASAVEKDNICLLIRLLLPLKRSGPIIAKNSQTVLSEPKYSHCAITHTSDSICTKTYYILTIRRRFKQY